MRRCPGFTLVELLVVVAIIALLVGILLPALGRARQSGRSAVCLSRLHQLAVAVYMYAEDNRGWYPQWGFDDEGDDGAANSWLRTMSSAYGQQEMILRCPDDRSPYWTQPLETRLRQTSYATNYFLADTDTELTERDGHPYNRMDWILRPGATIYFAELIDTGTRALADHIHPNEWAEQWPHEREYAATQVALDRHLGRANYALADGHAQPFAFEQTYQIDATQSARDQIVYLYNRYDPTLAQ